MTTFVFRYHNTLVGELARDLDETQLIETNIEKDFNFTQKKGIGLTIVVVLHCSLYHNIKIFNSKFLKLTDFSYNYKHVFLQT